MGGGGEDGGGDLGGGYSDESTFRRGDFWVIVGGSCGIMVLSKGD